MHKKLQHELQRNRAHYLHDFDLHVVAGLGSACKAYFRYIDDGLLFVDRQRVTDSSIFHLLNSWHPSIKTDPVHASTAEVFLDLRLSICPKTTGQGLEINYETFRKALNIYGYLPATSEHPEPVAASILHTEAIRLLRTNKNEFSYKRQVAFFEQKFRRRGHSRALFRDIFARYKFVNKSCILRSLQRKRASKIKPCVLKVKHSSYIQLGCHWQAF